MRRFGPGRWLINDQEGEVVLGKWRREKVWDVLGRLSEKQKVGLMGNVIAFVGELVGFEGA